MLLMKILLSKASAFAYHSAGSLHVQRKSEYWMRDHMFEIQNQFQQPITREGFTLRSDISCLGTWTRREGEAGL